jgi:hypothetical protein
LYIIREEYRDDESEDSASKSELNEQKEEEIVKFREGEIAQQMAALQLSTPMPTSPLQLKLLMRNEDETSQSKQVEFMISPTSTSDKSEGNKRHSISSVVSSKTQASVLATTMLARNNSNDRLAMEGSQSSGGRGSPFRSLTPSASFNVESSMINLLDNLSTDDIDYSKPKYSLKPLIIQQINDLMDDLNSVNDHVSAQALEHIHTG